MANAVGTYEPVSEYRELMEGIKTVHVDTEAGAVQIRPAPDTEELHAVFRFSKPEAARYFSMQVEREGSAVAIKLIQTSNLLPFNMENRILTEIELPDTFDSALKLSGTSGVSDISGLILKEIDVTQSSGSVMARGVTVGKLLINSSSSDVHLEQSRCGTLTVNIASGRADLSDIRAEEMQLRCATGQISMGAGYTDRFHLDMTAGEFTGHLYPMTDSGEKLRTRVSTGNAALCLGGFYKDATLHSASGSISLTVPKGICAAPGYPRGNRSITVGLPEGRPGAAAPQMVLDLEAAVGSIQIVPEET